LERRARDTRIPRVPPAPRAANKRRNSLRFTTGNPRRRPSPRVWGRAPPPRTGEHLGRTIKAGYVGAEGLQRGAAEIFGARPSSRRCVSGNSSGMRVMSSRRDEARTPRRKRSRRRGGVGPPPTHIPRSLSLSLSLSLSHTHTVPLCVRVRARVFVSVCEGAARGRGRVGEGLASSSYLASTPLVCREFAALNL
jgi:hypothetical protein